MEAPRVEKLRGSALDPFGTLIEAAAGLWWFVVAGWVLMIYVFVYFVLPGNVSAPVFVYVAQPLLWLSLAFVAYLGWRYALPERPAFSQSLVVMALLVGAVQIILFVVAGYLSGFGRSPYGQQVLSILGNLLYVGTMLAGVEMARAYLVVALGRRRPLLALALVCLFFSVLSIPFARYASLQRPPVFDTVGGLFLPTLSENLLATFLALLGGPLASIAYRGLLLAYEWLSPILPNLEWIVTAFLGTLVPALGLLLIYSQTQREPAGEGEDTSQKQGSMGAWVLVALVAAGLLWFNTGLFGVQPSLIASGSMSPALMAGDVVITRDVPAEEVQVGDIIRYRQGGSNIIHRVVDVQRNGDEITFTTRGDDNNNTDDPPVAEQQLAGKVVLTVPKVGWVAIGVRKAVGLIR